MTLHKFLILRPLSSFCAPFKNFTENISPALRNILPQISAFCAPSLGYARGGPSPAPSLRHCISINRRSLGSGSSTHTN